MSTVIVDTIAPSGGTLTVSSNVNATNFNTTSDENLKTDIVTIENAADKVSQLRGVNFTYRESGQYTMGVIAQETQAVIPEVVGEMPNGQLTVNYQAMVGVLIEAIKDLQARVDELENQ